jgi:hypothetical protein
LTKELDWYLLGPIEFGERAVRSGIALVIIGICFGYSYFKKRWKTLVLWFKLLHPFPFILILLFAITSFLDYCSESGRDDLFYLDLIFLAFTMIFVFIFHYELEQYRKDQNPDKDGG